MTSVDKEQKPIKMKNDININFKQIKRDFSSIINSNNNNNNGSPNIIIKIQSADNNSNISFNKIIENSQTPIDINHSENELKNNVKKEITQQRSVSPVQQKHLHQQEQQPQQKNVYPSSGPLIISSTPYGKKQKTDDHFERDSNITTPPKHVDKYQLKQYQNLKQYQLQNKHQHQHEHQHEPQHEPQHNHDNDDDDEHEHEHHSHEENDNGSDDQDEHHEQENELEQQVPAEQIGNIEIIGSYKQQQQQIEQQQNNNSNNNNLIESHPNANNSTPKCSRCGTVAYRKHDKRRYWCKPCSKPFTFKVLCACACIHMIQQYKKYDRK